MSYGHILSKVQFTVESVENTWKDTVTYRSIARERVGKHVSWDTKMKHVESWKPTRCCRINRHVHGYER
jgi:hypothetical protein